MLPKQVERPGDIWCSLRIRSIYGLKITMPPQALIHKSELSWDRVMRPEQVVRPGDVVRCKVTTVDADRARVNLSLKRMQVKMAMLQLLALKAYSCPGSDKI